MVQGKMCLAGKEKELAIKTACGDLRASVPTLAKGMEGTTCSPWPIWDSPWVRRGLCAGEL